MGAPINDGPRQNLGATFVTFNEPLLYQKIFSKNLFSSCIIFIFKKFDVIFSNQID